MKTGTEREKRKKEKVRTPQNPFTPAEVPHTEVGVEAVPLEVRPDDATTWNVEAGAALQAARQIALGRLGRIRGARKAVAAGD